MSLPYLNNITKLAKEKTYNYADPNSKRDIQRVLETNIS